MSKKHKHKSDFENRNTRSQTPKPEDALKELSNPVTNTVRILSVKAGDPAIKEAVAEKPGRTVH